MGAANRILVVSLDGATFDLMDGWLERGLLPNLARVIREGAHGRMKSTIPIITPSAYASISTGRRPGNSGVFDFVHRDSNSYDYRSINSASARGAPFWEMLSRAGKRVGLVNVPGTYPAGPINGFVVGCGLTTPTTDSPGFLYPEDLFSRHGLDPRAYILKPGWRVLRYERNLEAFMDEVVASFEQRSAVTLKLLASEPWDFFMVHFQITDWLQHAFWGDDAALLKGYQLVDASIGRMLDLVAEQATVIVMSDHGFGPVHRTVNLTNWLIENDLMVLNPISVGKLARKAADKLFHKMLGLHPDNLAVRLVRRGGSAVFNLVPGAVRRTLLDQPLTALCARHPSLYPRVGEYYFDRIDWKRTKAYTLGQMGAVFLNLEGREPQGIVRSDEYESLRNRIAEALSQLTDETSRPIIDRVYTREDLFDGECLERAPDLLAFTEQSLCYFHPDVDLPGVVTDPVHWRLGHHQPYGILMMRGANVRSGHRIDSDPVIVDLAPTVLFMAGVPLSPQFEGRPWTDCFYDTYVRERPLTYAAQIATEQEIDTDEDAEELIKRQLRGLGYL